MAPRVRPIEVAVIGGGATGVLVASRLLDASCAHPVRVRVVHGRGPLGGGIAYGTEDPEHLLNVRAGMMTADPSRPDDFAEWCRIARVGGPDDFVTRRAYRDYLVDHLDGSVAGAADGAVDVVREVAVAVEPGDRPQVVLASGDVLGADVVVLATGNAPPTTPATLAPIESTPAWVADPWAPDVVDRLAAASRVVLVGTGLTAVDMAITARRVGSAALVAVSRHALLPQVHTARSTSPPVDLRAIERSRDLRDLVRAVREAADGSEGCDDWRAVVDAVRPIVNWLWWHLAPDERRRARDHLARFWDVHRHRMPPASARVVADLQADGRLEVVPGRIAAAACRGGGVRVVVAHGGIERVLDADLVVNCTGPGRPWAPPVNPAVHDLVARRGAVVHELGTGLVVSRCGELLDRASTPLPGVLAVGPLRRGVFAETTAVPEIARQALHVADLVVATRVPSAVG